MFASARQGCMRSGISYALCNRPSWSLVLHAESSRQALSRALRRSGLASPPARNAHTRARFSAAAAAVVEHEAPPHMAEMDRSEWVERGGNVEEQYDRSSTTTAPVSGSQGRTRKNRPPPAPPDHPDSPLERFRRLAASDPLASLHILPTMPPDQLASLTIVELHYLIESLHIALRSLPLPTLDPDDTHTALVQLRAVIHEFPSGRFAGERLRGKMLYRFIRVCLLLGDRDLVRAVWKERLQEQATRGVRLIKSDRVAQIIADDLRDWRMMLWMFNPTIFPVELFSSTVLDRYIQAHLVTRQPEKVRGLFDLHAELGLNPAPESYNHLVQAMLEMGNVEGARQAASMARSTGRVTASDQQLAILHGHRTLGWNAEVEDRVLRDIKKLGFQPDGRLLNALIRLRLTSNDLPGAEQLLEYFGLDPTKNGAKAASARNPRPDSTTFSLAFNIAEKNRDLIKVRAMWTRLCETPKDVTDAHLATLITALNGDGRQQEAYNIVADMTLSDKEASDLPMPLGLRPGIRTLNSLLGGLQRRDFNAFSLSRIFDLYHQLDIKPDDHTSEILLTLLSRTHIEPDRLAIFLDSLRKQHPQLSPTISHLNTIFEAAVRTASAASTPPLATDEDLEPYDTESHAGLQALDPLRRALRSTSQSLKARQIASDSDTLATRLRFDAFKHAASGGFPSAQKVWQSMLQRGFRPDKRHILALMMGYADSGALSEAQSLFNLAHELDIEVTNAMRMVLLTGWAAAGQLTKARAVYREIRASADGADMAAVTAMIQAFYFKGAFDHAAELVHTDLADLGPPDKRALVVAAKALRAVKAEMQALDLIRNNMQAMSHEARVVVRQLLNWLSKQVEKEGTASWQGQEWERAIGACREILETRYDRRREDGPTAKSLTKGILKSLRNDDGKKRFQEQRSTR